MILKLNHTDYAVSITDDDCVCLPALGYRANDLSVLLELLKQDYAKVKLPPNLFTEDLTVIEQCMRLGFKSLECQDIMIDGDLASVRPWGYASSQERKAAPTADHSQFRTYFATRLEGDRKGSHAIFTEATLIQCGVIS